MTTNEKITLINKAIDHLLDLAIGESLSGDELMYLYHVFWCIRQYYRIMDKKGVNTK